MTYTEPHRGSASIGGIFVKRAMPLVRQLFGLSLIVGIMVLLGTGCDLHNPPWYNDKNLETPTATTPPPPPEEKSQLQNWEAGGSMDPSYVRPDWPLKPGDTVTFIFPDATTRKMSTLEMKVDENRDLTIPVGCEKRIPRQIDFGTSGFRKGSELYAVVNGRLIESGSKIRIMAAPPVKVKPGETDAEALAIVAKGWMP